MSEIHIDIDIPQLEDDLANGEANSPAALLARNAILEARLKCSTCGGGEVVESYCGECAGEGMNQESEVLREKAELEARLTEETELVRKLNGDISVTDATIGDLKAQMAEWKTVAAAENTKLLREREHAEAERDAANKHAERMELTVDAALEDAEKAIAERDEARSYALRENFANNPIVTAAEARLKEAESRAEKAEGDIAGLGVLLAASARRLELRLKEKAELEELFRANQRDITEMVAGALGYEQATDALGAVQRLAERWKELSALYVETGKRAEQAESSRDEAYRRLECANQDNAKLSMGRGAAIERVTVVAGERDTAIHRAEQAEARAEAAEKERDEAHLDKDAAISILADMHSDEGCQFKGAQGTDALKAQIKDEILTAALAYGRTCRAEYLEQIRALTGVLDNRRSAKYAISAHAITRYMQRSGSKSRTGAEKSLKKILDNAEEMELKDQWKALQLINHNFKDAAYLKYQSWLLVIVNHTLVTCHFAEAKRWRKLNSREPAIERVAL